MTAPMRLVYGIGKGWNVKHYYTRKRKSRSYT